MLNSFLQPVGAGFSCDLPNQGAIFPCTVLLKRSKRCFRRASAPAQVPDNGKQQICRPAVRSRDKRRACHTRWKSSARGPVGKGGTLPAGIAVFLRQPVTQIFFKVDRSHNRIGFTTLQRHGRKPCCFTNSGAIGTGAAFLQ